MDFDAPIEERLAAWDALLSATRMFFRSRGFWEVSTPARVEAPIPEPNIDAIPAGEMFLRTSPEAEMKMLLSEGAKRIFQIGPCFRLGEVGRLHREEFTMLEWYETNADCGDLIPFTQDMLLALAQSLLGRPALRFQGIEIDLTPSRWIVASLDEVFAELAGASLDAAVNDGSFDQKMVELVEPRLPRERPIVLRGFPASQSTLAKTSEDGRLADRWELYLGGVEIANTYSELTDKDEMAERARSANRLRVEQGKEAFPPHRGFEAAAAKGIPESAGSALGMNRLAMIFFDLPAIPSSSI